MGYIQRNLAEGEHIVYQTKLHWVAFVWPPFFFLMAYAAFKSGFDIFAQIFLALSLVIGLVTICMYLLSEFAVTNRRIFGKIGGTRVPRHLEVTLIELRDAKFKPGILHKLFDYGTVVITDRAGVRHKFSCVSTQFYHHVQARDKRVRKVLRKQPPVPYP